MKLKPLTPTPSLASSGGGEFNEIFDGKEMPDETEGYYSVTFKDKDKALIDQIKVAWAELVGGEDDAA